MPRWLRGSLSKSPFHGDAHRDEGRAKLPGWITSGIDARVGAGQDSHRLFLTLLVVWLAAFSIAWLSPRSAAGFPTAFPAAGIGLAALRLLPRNRLPSFGVLLLGAGWAGFTLAGFDPAAALGLSLASMAELLLLGALFRLRGARRPGSATVKGVGWFITGSIFAPVLVGALVAAGCSSLSRPGLDFPGCWLAWASGHAAGLLVASPLVLAIARFENREETLEPAMLPRLVAFSLLWALAARFCFDLPFTGQGVEIEPYLFIVPIAWSAWYFGPGANSLLIFILAAVGGLSPAVRLGPSSLGGEDPATRMAAFQVFVGVAAIVSSLISTGFSEQRRASLGYERERARFAGIFSRSPDGIFTTDGRARFTEINDAACAMLGYPRGELLELGIRDILGSPERMELEGALARFPAGSDFTRRSRLVRRDGGLVEVEVRGRIYSDRHIEGTVRDISESVARAERLRKALAEKQALIRELHHRSNNNMQVISAILGFQAHTLDDPRLSAAIEDTQDRIAAMALVNRLLYEAQDLSRIDLGRYARELAQVVGQRHRRGDRPLGLRLDSDCVSVMIDTAIPCGLIMNELISNAYRHAYPGGEEGEILISLKRGADGIIALRVADRGRGVGPDFDPREQAGIGLVNVVVLSTEQLKGDIAFETESGFACEVRFRDNLYTARV